MSVAIMRIAAVSLSLGIAASLTEAKEEDNVKTGNIILLAPKSHGGMPVMDALASRESRRDFSGGDLPLEKLSSLLWAAAGYNRAEEGKRTAASTRNWQSVEIYAALRQGVYFYNAKKNLLELVDEGDFRAETGMQDFVKDAAVNLIFVGDTTKMEISDPSRQMLLFGADIGLMSGNAYLYCASEGLKTVIRGSLDGVALAKRLKLPSTKVVLMAQSVGL